MTLHVGEYTIERVAISCCDVCRQRELDGIVIDGIVDQPARVCVDCFTKALRLPSDELVTRLQVLLRDVETSLSRGRFPTPDLFRRLRREIT